MLEPQERLRNAIIKGNLPITKRLLSRFPELWLNVDPNHKGWCNLHFASYHGNYLICFHLISFINKNFESLKDSYSHLDLLTFDGLTVLHLPLINHHSQTLHYLLQEFPGELWLNFPGGSLKQTPLHYSCIYGFREGIKLLLEFGAKWELQDANGNTCLHYCFQYGNYECIQALLKLILVHFSEKEEAIAKFKELESIKNNRGWLAIDYSSTFELVKNYKDLKEELFSINYDLKESIPLAELGSANSSVLHLVNTNYSQMSIAGNKVLSSPIIPMSQTQQVQRENNPVATSAEEPISSNDTRIKGRAHSQSLPTTSTVPDSISMNKSVTVRKRSNTSYNYRPPNLINANSIAAPRTPSLPHTPITQSASNKTPSIKSVTISPSVRNNPNNDNEIPVSPQSVASNNSLANTSPTNPSNSSRRMTLSYGQGIFPLTAINLQINENDQWPVINTSPTHIIAQSIAVQDPRLVSVHEQADVESPSQVTSDSTTSSPIKQYAPHSSDKPITRRPSSASSIDARRVFNASRSSLNEGAHRQAPSPNKSLIDTSPVLRKTKSFVSISNYQMSESKSSSSPTLENYVENGADSMKRSNISNISFSRVR